MRELGSGRGGGRVEGSKTHTVHITQTTAKSQEQLQFHTALPTQTLKEIRRFERDRTTSQAFPHRLGRGRDKLTAQSQQQSTPACAVLQTTGPGTHRCRAEQAEALWTCDLPPRAAESHSLPLPRFGAHGGVGGSCESHGVPELAELPGGMLTVHASVFQRKGSIVLVLRCRSLPPRTLVNMGGHFGLSQSGRINPALNVWRPGMLMDTLQGTGCPPFAQKNDLSPNVNQSTKPGCFNIFSEIQTQTATLHSCWGG